MALIATQHLVDAGTAPTFTTPGAADTVEYGNGTNTFVVIKNAHATDAVTVNFTVSGNTDYGQPYPDPALSVAALSEKWIPIRKAYDDGTATGHAVLGISGTGTPTVAVIRVP